LYLDPLFVRSLSVDQLSAILIHEVSHLLRDHPDRSDRIGVTVATAGWANACQDAEINGDLMEFEFPGRPVYPGDVGARPGDPWEIAFLQSSRTTTAPHDCGSGATSGPSRAHELQPTNGAAIAGARAEQIRDVTAAEIARATPGSVGRGWAGWSETRLNRRVDWRLELRAHMRSSFATIVGRDNRTRNRPSRRYPGWPVVLPGIVGSRLQATVILDTSGSIDSDLLASFLGEIDGVACASGAAIEILEVDSEVRARTLAMRAPHRVQGGGSTDLRAAFTMLEANGSRVDVIIVLTDGMTPWPTKRPRAPVIGVFPTPGAFDSPDWVKVVRLPAIQPRVVTYIDGSQKW
jgi:predicted metal-dependent peptidase